jgi:hypothetical protein
MKAWIGPVLAAAQTAREQAARDHAPPSESGTAERTADIHVDPAAQGPPAKAQMSDTRRGLAGWWRRLTR